jgi:creatinine amidohydrolase
MAYHIHETGYHAPLLKEVMGGINPRLGALPPHLVLETLLYQLREFYNAGFGGAVVISGHHGAQNDLRMIGEAFSASFEFSAFVRTDPELVAGAHIGDHAGQYEISASRHSSRSCESREGGSRRFRSFGTVCTKPDAIDASAEQGRAILEFSVRTIEKVLRGMVLKQPARFITMDQLDAVWRPIAAQKHRWATLNS